LYVLARITIGCNHHLWVFGFYHHWGERTPSTIPLEFGVWAERSCAAMQAALRRSDCEEL